MNSILNQKKMKELKKKLQDFKNKLFIKEINKRDLFDHLKVNYNFKEQKYIIENIPKSFDSLIYGTPIQKTYKNFGTKKLCNIGSLESELNWLVHLFRKYSNELNIFQRKKEKYEILFLLGKYEESERILNEIKEITYSYWGLENRFLQTQYQKGLEFNFKLLNKSKQQQIDDPTFYYLVHFFSYKVEEDSSYFSYVNSLENSLNWGMSNSYKNYFLYRLNSINHNYEDIESLIWATSNLPLIDKYILFKDIVSNIITNTSMKEYHNFIIDISNYLSKFLEDDFYFKMKLLAFDCTQIEMGVDLDQMELIDMFTIGDYEKVITKFNSCYQDIINFQTIEIYAKSLIHTNKEIDEEIFHSTIVASIIRLVHKILKRNESSNEAIIELLTLTNALSSFDISKEIISFLSLHINKEERKDNNSNAFIFSKSYNPIFHEIFETEKQKINYLKLNKTEKNLTTNFFIDIINEKEGYNYSIPEYRVNFYFGKNKFEKRKFEYSIVKIKNTIKEIDNISYLKEKCIKLLFFSYIEIEDYNSAIDLYVNNYIENPQLVSKINGSSLSNLIVKNSWKKINHFNINFPIFIFLNHSDIHPKYIAYDIYLRTQNVTRPTMLNDIENIETKNKIFFLRNISNQKIISRKAIVFKNTREVLEERISICQILSKIDPINIEDYSNEISDITQRITVQQRIKEIDESKIYIDENGILEKELDEVNKSFNRFKNISQLLKENNIDATGIGYDALYDLLKGNIDAETYKKSLRKTDIHFELFTQLFLEIRDKFLFSNQYGLDYYLSQRIRHGTIINQLRKSFKTYNLITTKNSKGEGYLSNEYWLNKFSKEDEYSNELDRKLNTFSNKIDNIITNCKNKYIQIKTEDPKTVQTGWFDYTYIPIWNSTWLYSLFIKELQFFTNFEDFVKSIYEILWEVTDRNLTLIRNKLDEEVKRELIEELDKLEVDLKKILPAKLSPSLFRSIAECRTNVQADTAYVISWFNKSKNYEIDFTIDDALNTSLQILNNIISPNILNIQIENNTSNNKIKGQYFTHFVDLIKIFLTNIYEYYTKSEIENKITKIEALQEEEKIVVIFSNTLKNEEDISNLRQIIEKKLVDSENHKKGIRGEGSTGFPKANNILQNVFRNKSNNINFDITQETFLVKCEIQFKNLIV